MGEEVLQLRPGIGDALRKAGLVQLIQPDQVSPLKRANHRLRDLVGLSNGYLCRALLRFDHDTVVGSRG